MNTVTVLLLIYSWYYFGVCQGGDVSRCTTGLISLDLPLNEKRLRNQEQRIFPNINFTCDGAITKWIVGGRWDGSDGYYPDLQIWRSSGVDTYTKVGNTTIRVESESETEIYEYSPDPPLEFQAGDILGIFQPARRDNRLSVYYGEDDGLTSYYIRTDDDDAEPPFDDFNITSSNVRIDYDLRPLVTIEIETEISTTPSHGRPSTLTHPSNSLTTPTPGLTTTDRDTSDKSSQQRSILIPAIAGAAGGLVVVISVLVTMVAIYIRKKRGSKASDRQEFDGTITNDLTENVAYKIHADGIPTSQNVAYNDVQNSGGDEDERYMLNDLIYDEPRAI